MIVAVRVTARAAQRTLARDFDRDVRAVARKNAAPGLNDLARADVACHSVVYYLLLFYERQNPCKNDGTCITKNYARRCQRADSAWDGRRFNEHRTKWLVGKSCWCPRLGRSGRQ